MKRLQEKVKDIVDVRVYESLIDFTSEPAQTLATYHFTDGTAELMAKWLNAIVDVKPGSGAARALAGYRGVGKSHFLATLAAIVSNPELRLNVTDAHVSASAQRLLRRHYQIAYVRRGTAATLFEEFKAGISQFLGTEASSVGDSIPEILQSAAARSGELPFVLIIDTALERGERVARDDGSFLSEIAVAAASLNIFVGIALDDDISGADGSNSGIARTFAIDYLDQEHLYKVVNSFVFPKFGNMQPVLQEIYADFRQVLPNFKWSEQRFTALYPLHPAILEVAPFVRLYVHDFALLRFASSAAERIMGRPANSLIALDEVFDSVEKSLRKIDDLKEAFTAYDQLNSTVVAKIPVMQRLQAKLILKALLLLSLDGQGATAGEIAASMLIFDESDPQLAVSNVELLIQTFKDALPDDIRVTSEEGRSPRFGFSVRSKDGLNQALAEKTHAIAEGFVDSMLRRFLVDRFADCDISATDDETKKDAVECGIVWRGSLRPGMVSITNGADEAPGVDHALDWIVEIDLKNSESIASNGPDGRARIKWKPDALRKDETETLLRHYVLANDPEIREQFIEEMRAALHSHSVSSERILNRVFLEDGNLVIDGFDYNFTEDARSASTLSELFSIMLEPLFETQFPSHPVFSRTLAMSDVDTLATELFSGARQNLPEIQGLAAAFALPLGLVRSVSGSLVPESEEVLGQLPLVADVLKVIDVTSENVTKLSEIDSILHRQPFGLTREAQRLMLTALVAQRKVEFVTFKGDRINRRSLDLKIIWDDIVGIAAPTGAVFSGKKLAEWAALFTGQSELLSLDVEADRAKIREALDSWAVEWREIDLAGRFAQLDDHLFNNRIWRTADQCLRSFGTSAENIDRFLESAITLDECLARIVDTFNDDVEKYQIAAGQRAILDSFVSGINERSEILSYLSGSELTDDAEIEDMREQVYRSTETCLLNPSDASNREMGYLWQKFQRDYSEYYLEKHHQWMSQSRIKSELEAVLRSNEWWELESLSQVPFLSSEPLEAVKKQLVKLQSAICSANLGELLMNRAHCVCAFRLSELNAGERSLMSLRQLIAQGRGQFRSVLTHNANTIGPQLKKAADKIGTSEVSAAATELAAKIKDGSTSQLFTELEIKLLRKVELTGSPAVIEMPKKRGETEISTPQLELPADRAAEDEVVLASL